MYTRALQALKAQNRLRKKSSVKTLQDFGTNDYLDLATNKQILAQTIAQIQKAQTVGARASQLVGGHQKEFKAFERYTSRLNGFDDCLIFGSGFLANMALFEALPSRQDLLLVDDDYHASGIVGTKLTKARVEFFAHNDAKDLQEKLQKASNYKNIFVAIEGVYSMGGDLASLDVINLAKKYNAVLIVDEAHSAGTIGKNLLGIFDYYSIAPTNKDIRLSTLGKAYGSYGAYVLANAQTIDFLQNRAKSFIYSTAPSVFDILYAHNAMKYVQKNKAKLNQKIQTAKAQAQEILGITSASLILPIPVNSSKKLLNIQKTLKTKGFFTGAIRPPTVKRPIIRAILKPNKPNLKVFLKNLANLTN